MIELAQFIEQNKGFEQAKVLLAFSGGIDSSVLAHLLYAGSIDFSIAHVNYKLRGSESDADAQFAREQAKLYGVSFYYLEAPIRPKSVSIQSRARSIRYEWFEKLRIDNSIDYIATAHHKDDAIETKLIQLFRGSHFKQWIKLDSRDVIKRPLISYWRSDIEQYAATHALSWRVDSSNSSNTYLRNYIRNKVIPGLSELLPDIKNRLLFTVETLDEQYAVLESYRSLLEKQVLENNKYQIDKLLELDPLGAHLQLLFAHFGKVDLGALPSLLHAENGKQIVIGQTRFVRFDNFLFLGPLTQPPKYSSFRIVGKQGSTTPKYETNCIYIDPNKINGSLSIRTWASSDRISIGPKGTRKSVAKVLRDLKIPPFEKEQICVLVDQCGIIAILDHVIAEDFRLKDDTSNSMKICYW